MERSQFHFLNVTKWMRSIEGLYIILSCVDVVPFWEWNWMNDLRQIFACTLWSCGPVTGTGNCLSLKQRRSSLKNEFYFFSSRAACIFTLSITMSLGTWIISNKIKNSQIVKKLFDIRADAVSKFIIKCVQQSTTKVYMPSCKNLLSTCLGYINLGDTTDRNCIQKPVVHLRYCTCSFGVSLPLIYTDPKATAPIISPAKTSQWLARKESADL